MSTPKMTGGGVGEEEAVVTMLATLASAWRRIIALALTLGILGGGVGFLLSGYRATARFVPQESAGSTSALLGLAAQFGVTAGGAGGMGEGIPFYEQLVESREVLDSLAFSTFALPGTDSSATQQTLISILGVEEDTRAETGLVAVRKLRSKIRVSSDLAAGVLTVSVSMPTPELAEAVCRRLLTLINEFDTKRRNTTARAEREFVEARLNEGRDSLAAVEKVLERFLDDNRTYQQSPRLTFQAASIQREVDLRQRAVLTMAEAYERARVDEVRNTPVITILEAPEGSADRAKTAVVLAVTGVALGVVGMVALIVLVELFRQRMSLQPELYGGLHASWTGLLKGLHLQRVWDRMMSFVTGK